MNLTEIFEAVESKIVVYCLNAEKYISNVIKHNKPCEKMSLSEFMEKYSLRFKKVVQSCRNVQELETAEKYIWNGLRTKVCNPDSDNAWEYVRLLIRPKRLELEEIYKGEIED